MVRKENISVWGSNFRRYNWRRFRGGSHGSWTLPPLDALRTPAGAAPTWVCSRVAQAAWFAAVMLTCEILIWTRGGVDRRTGYTGGAEKAGEGQAYQRVGWRRGAWGWVGVRPRARPLAVTHAASCVRPAPDPANSRVCVLQPFLRT